MADLTLAALGMERRTVSLALFTKAHMEDVIVHHIPAEMEKALNAFSGFLSRTLEFHTIEYMALARLPPATSSRLQRMHEICLEILHRHGIPYIQIPASDLFACYAHPPIAHKDHLRKVGRAIWPMLNAQRSPRSSIDAALLGLHVQVQRMLNRCVEGA
jgi:hypothetical protein